jgi:hypothetical protein
MNAISFFNIFDIFSNGVQKAPLVLIRFIRVFHHIFFTNKTNFYFLRVQMLLNLFNSVRGWV